MRRSAGVEAGLGALAVLLALMMPAQAEIGEMKTFRDWIAGCDNTKSCTALSLPDEGDESVAYLRLDRPAGPDGAPKLALKLRREKLKPSFEIELALDGAPFPTAGRRFSVSSNDGETAEIAFGPAEIEAFVAGARKATALTLKQDGRSQKLSLAGSVAAMLWIDEQQRRLNTASALIRKGTAGSAPPAPALPTIPTKPAIGKPLTKAQSVALVKAMRQELNRREPDSCEDIPEGFTDTDGAFALYETTQLVVVACSRGAYNVSSQFWIVPERDVRRAKPAEFEGSRDNELVNADFDPKTGRVMFFAKGRGIGDCGTSGSYNWNGAYFAVLQLSAMGQCRLIPGDDWIELFRSVGN